MNFDMDKFYSQDEISAWQSIIGKDLHYHYGFFAASEDLETGLRQTVKNFYDDIETNTQILDIGCGWGGPAQMLVRDRNCSVKGITISEGQANYCKQQGLDVEILDVDTQPIQGKYDIVFSLEVLSHIRNKAEVLRKLRQCSSRLILSCNCVANHLAKENRRAFSSSMVMCTEKELYDMLVKAGWSITKKRNRRFQSLRTITLWGEQLQKVYGDSSPPQGHLADLKILVEYALESIMVWGINNPLIDIVAE
jgi:cyclopropane fatty-acyl-phospholipid synthase-like methyltransferase